MADPKSELAKAAGSDGYSLTEHLLFLVLDQLRWIAWTKTKEGTKQPDPLSPLAKASTPEIAEPSAEVKALLAKLGPGGEGL